jgi:O-antigen ligase
MMGILVFLISRFGWRRALWSGVLLIAPILVLFGGRQTSLGLNDTDDTAQGRIHLWSDSLVLMRGSPIFGIGVGQLAEANGLVAHNSYVHMFAELGLGGGTLFVGAWYVLVTALRAHGRKPASPSAVWRWRPYVLAMMASYAAGLYSLSRCYVLPTYLVLACAGACAALLPGDGVPSTVALSRRLCLKVIGVGAGTLMFLHIFVRVMAR